MVASSVSSLRPQALHPSTSGSSDHICCVATDMHEVSRSCSAGGRASSSSFVTVTTTVVIIVVCIYGFGYEGLGRSGATCLWPLEQLQVCQSLLCSQTSLV